MSRFTTVMIGMVLLASPLAVPTSAGAASTDMDRFQKLVDKYAPPAAGLPSPVKSLCVCQDGSNEDGAVGTVVSQGTTSVLGDTLLKVACAVEGFDNTGTETIAFTCTRWVPLAK